MSDGELNSKTVKELRALAASLGISGAGRLRKEELVERLVAAGEARASGPTDGAVTVPPVLAPTRERGKPSSGAGVAVPERCPESPAVASSEVAVASSEVAVASSEVAVASSEVAVASSEVAVASSEVAVASDRTPAVPEPLTAKPSAPPPSYPGDRLRAMVRDPGTVYVYWEQEERGEEGWEVAALDADGGALDSFRTDRAGTSGYLKVPHGAIGQIQLRRVLPDGVTAPAASTWLAAPRSTVSADTTHRWVEVVPGEPAVRAAGPERLIERPAPEAPPAPVVATPLVVEDLPWSGDLPHLPSSLQARRDA